MHKCTYRSHILKWDGDKTTGDFNRIKARVTAFLHVVSDSIGSLADHMLNPSPCAHIPDDAS